jgi:hypothetical protein
MSHPGGFRKERCQKRIWPSSWNGWGQCPGHVMPNGNCSAYGSQHRVDPHSVALGGAPPPLIDADADDPKEFDP